MTKAQQKKRNKIIAGYMKVGLTPRNIRTLLVMFYPELLQNRDITEQRIGQIMQEVQRGEK